MIISKKDCWFPASTNSGESGTTQGHGDTGVNPDLLFQSGRSAQAFACWQDFLSAISRAGDSVHGTAKGVMIPSPHNKNPE
jgi:hypothetical protein